MNAYDSMRLKQIAEKVSSDISFRDTCAVAALQGALSDTDFWAALERQVINGGKGTLHQVAAQIAYAFADAMDEERKKSR